VIKATRSALLSVLILSMFPPTSFAFNNVRKIFRYEDPVTRTPKYGVVEGDTVYKMGAIKSIKKLSHLIDTNSLNRLSDYEKIDNPKKFFKKVKLLTPIPEPKQQIAVALNYVNHREESRLKDQVFFPKFSKLTPWNSKVNLYADKKGLLDYEVEWAFVLKKEINRRNIHSLNKSNIAEYIGGPRLQERWPVL
jgi:2-keto-4-pentenoate hydratase/2-oxohepta-3-ene-1,7-dioic acid hydratase in catechol pathway